MYLKIIFNHTGIYLPCRTNWTAYVKVVIILAVKLGLYIYLKKWGINFQGEHLKINFRKIKFIQLTNNYY